MRVNMLDLVNAEKVDVHKLRIINEYVNHLIKYVVDGARNNWQSPNETLALKTGDCEDFAILKYAIAKKVGIKGDLAVVNIIETNRLHMIFCSQGNVYDNAYADPRMKEWCTDYRPVYGFDNQRMFIFDEHWKKTPGPSRTISKWEGLKEQLEIPDSSLI